MNGKNGRNKISIGFCLCGCKQKTRINRNGKFCKFVRGHHIVSKETKLLLSKLKKGKSSWNKGISCSEETKRKISKKLKGRKLKPESIAKMLKTRKLRKTKHKHHIDLNKSNNKQSNFLVMSPSSHQRLHQKAYTYLVEKGLIRKYIKWCIKKYNLEVFDE